MIDWLIGAYCQTNPFRLQVYERRVRRPFQISIGLFVTIEGFCEWKEEEEEILFCQTNNRNVMKYKYNTD